MSEQRSDLFNLAIEITRQHAAAILQGVPFDVIEVVPVECAANIARADAFREELRRHAGCTLLHPEQCDGRAPINPQLDPEQLAETRREEHAAWVNALRQLPEAHNSAGTLHAREERRRS